MESSTPKKIVPKKTPGAEQIPAVRRTNFEEVALGYSIEQALLEASRCLQCKKPLCITGCPVGVPIPRFIKAVHQNDLACAIEIIKEANLLPAVCGRVCPQENQCEKHCALSKKFDAVAIGRLEPVHGGLGAATGEQQNAGLRTLDRQKGGDYRGAVRRASPAPMTLQSWGTASRSTRRFTRRAACLFTGFQSFACRR